MPRRQLQAVVSPPRGRLADPPIAFQASRRVHFGAATAVDDLVVARAQAMQFISGLQRGTGSSGKQESCCGRSGTHEEEDHEVAYRVPRRPAPAPGRGKKHPVQQPGSGAQGADEAEGEFIEPAPVCDECQHTGEPYPKNESDN